METQTVFERLIRGARGALPPPRAALLARAVEKARSEPESAIVRFTVEFLRPVQSV